MQVDKKHYKFDCYVDMCRWCSYYYQIREAVNYGAENILLIGGGDGIVPSVLKEMGLNVTTFDFAEDLSPDIVGDIREIKKLVKKDVYNCIICCQVLEHLEFKYFEKIIKSFSDILKKDGVVIISLPQQRSWFKYYINLLGREFKHILTIPKFWKGKFKFDGEHYWEVSTLGCSRKMLMDCLKKYFILEKIFTPWENPYHWFCVLKP